MTTQCLASLEYDIGFAGQWANCAHRDVTIYCDGEHPPDGVHIAVVDFSGTRATLTWVDHFYNPEPAKEQSK